MVDEEHNAQDEVARTFVINYDDEAARKRAEYHIEEKSDNFQTYDGMIRRFTGTEEELDEQYEALVGKVGDENIRVERAGEVEMEELSTSETIIYDVDGDEGPVKGFLDYWFTSAAPGAKKRGENSAELYSKTAGRATVDYDTETTDKGTKVETNWEASSQEAISEFRSMFEEEFDIFRNPDL